MWPGVSNGALDRGFVFFLRDGNVTGDFLEQNGEQNSQSLHILWWLVFFGPKKSRMENEWHKRNIENFKEI